MMSGFQHDYNHRIVCLLPAATDICIALGLQDQIVGVTHECNVKGLPSDRIKILTLDGVQAETSTQGEIHQAIQDQQNRQLNESCSTVPSLYPVNKELLIACQPTIIFTQDLCHVCAPSSRTVQSMLDDGKNSNNNQHQNEEVSIVSLTPHCLAEVAETFVQVATACGIVGEGMKLKQQFLEKFQLIKDTIVSASKNSQQNNALPRILLLEWLDPPFEAGHWIPELMYYANVEPVRVVPNETKSTAVTWQQIKLVNPIDVVLVSCCGFQLERNYQDAIKFQRQLKNYCQPASQNHNVYAINADRYIVNPNPDLVFGAVIMAMIAYIDNPEVVRALANLNFVPQDITEEWKQVNFQDCQDIQDSTSTISVNAITQSSITQFGLAPATDIEDLVSSSSQAQQHQQHDFDEIHHKACQERKNSYSDPETGYNVFTEIFHLKRGYCCGSGCRHCPFHHVGVSSEKKAAKIQQPSFIYRTSGTDTDDNIFALQEGMNVRVLFFSGGKDSFLTIRALVRQAKEGGEAFGLVLLTTFDASSRIVAHQNVHIDDISRQAKHLKISLLGVPLHRGNKKEGYLARIKRGLEVIQKEIGSQSNISALVFGDLHLEHIYQWRQEQLGSLGYKMLFPLFHAHYKVLEQDLDASQVPCEISSSTLDSSTVVAVGDIYNNEFRRNLERNFPSIDLFGETGEFHTLAKVWEVPRSVALGL